MPLMKLTACFLCALTIVIGQSSPNSTKNVPRGLAQIALPQLSDALGWKQPMYYSTIQTADIDGDGQTEVLARWIDGLDIYRFENGTLFRDSRIPALSDNAGFHQPSWYSTIRAAKLDSKLGQADIIAREHDGIHVFRYNAERREWREIGSPGSLRPFADKDADGADWTQPKHYLTIQAGDVTGDGAAELLGRGRNGMQVWQWNPTAESWTNLGSAGVLTDAQGFHEEPYYHPIQLVDVDHDGIAELVSRAPVGVQTHKWSSGGWTMIHAGGPFGDDAGVLTRNRHKSVKTFVDAAGQAWLYGVAAGHADSGAIQVHRWKEGRWQPVRTLPLPGGGWDRENMFATLTAADIDGDADPEFLMRGPGGLHAFTLTGSPVPMHSQSFTDAQGWNLIEHHSTLRTAAAKLTEQSGSKLRTLVIGRGPEGLEVYKYDGQWTTAAESNFPQYCANPNDTSANCIAYQTLSGKLIDGQVDIRSQYTQATYGAGNWKTFQSTLNDMSNPIGPANEQAWESVKSEMIEELGYVATVRGWFDNNYKVLNDSYNRSADLLGEAKTNVSLADQTTVAAKWIEFAGDIVGGLARFTDGGGKSLNLVLAILKDLYNNLASSGGDINEKIAQIYTDLNTQKSNLNDTHATQQTSYLTDYSKLQQIGRDTTSGGFDWANATLDDIANAQNGAANGMRINFYKALLPSKWQVYWCYAFGNFGPSCGSVYTEDKYFCQFGHQVGLGDYSNMAYIYAGYSTSVNWGLLDKLTGTGAEDLNAIWYMMMLGGDLGWDLPQWGTENNGPYVNYADPSLAYDKIKNGYNGPSSSCIGNGSTTGIVSGNQTLSQRLSIAQHNTKRISAAEANGILKEMSALTLKARIAAQNRDVESELTSPLWAATKLIGRASTSPQGSASATTPTHLMELFVRRVQLQTQERVKSQAENLTTHAYCVIAALEGQKQLDESCQ